LNLFRQSRIGRVLRKRKSTDFNQFQKAVLLKQGHLDYHYFMESFAT